MKTEITNDMVEQVVNEIENEYNSSINNTSNEYTNETKDAFYRSAEKLLEVSKILEPFNELYSLLFLNHAQTLIMYIDKNPDIGYGDNMTRQNSCTENCSCENNQNQSTSLNEEDLDDIINQIEQEINNEVYN